MTGRAELHSLVDALADDDLNDARRVLLGVAGGPRAGRPGWPSAYVGCFDSDVVIGRRIDEVLGAPPAPRWS